ncbi:hypothetical protein ES705_41710 [subsurface metagenome]
MPAPVNAFSQDEEVTAKDTTEFETWERFSLSFGGFFAGLNSDMLIGSQQLGLGIFLDLEAALGLETSTLVLRGDMVYRFGKRRRHSARLTYFRFMRNANKVIESEIEIGDEIYPVGTEVESKFNLRIYKGTYDYSFFMDDRFDLGVSIGLFVMPVTFSTTALGSTGTVTEFTAPLPVLGLRTDFAITPKLLLKQSIHILYDYPLFDFVGSLKMDYTGLLFYAKFYF